MNVSSCDDMNKNFYDRQWCSRTLSRCSAHHRDKFLNVLLLSLSYTRRLCSKQNSPERLEVLREKPSVYVCFWRPCPPLSHYHLSTSGWCLLFGSWHYSCLCRSHTYALKKRWKHRCIRTHMRGGPTVWLRTLISHLTWVAGGTWCTQTTHRSRSLMGASWRVWSN